MAYTIIGAQPVIDVRRFGAVPSNDGSIDASAGLQRAIDYAKTVSAAGAGNAVITGGGRNYGLSTSLLTTGLYNAEIQNIGLKPASGFSSSAYLISAATNTARVTLRGVNMFCAGACNGLYLDTTNTYSVLDSEIFGAKIGVRATGASNPNLRLVNNNIQFSMAGVWTPSAGRKNNTGLWLDTPDAYLFKNTVATYETNILLDTKFGGLVMVGNHPWGTREDITTVSSIADNGSGKLRVVCAASHGMSTNDLVRVGTSGTVKALGFVSVIDSTTLDFPHVSYTGGMAIAGDLVSLQHIALKATAVYGDGISDDYLIGWNYFDTASVILEDAFQGQFQNNYGHQGCKAFFVATRANTTLDNFAGEPNRFSAEPELVAKIGGSGSWSYPTGMIGAGSSTQFDGDLPIGRGRLSFAKGSASKPALRFDDDVAGTKATYGIWSAGVTKLNFGWSQMWQLDTATGTMVMGHTDALTAGNGIVSLLQVLGTTGTAGPTFARFSNNTLGPRVQLGKGRGTTVGSVAAVSSGDELGLIHWFGADGTDLTNNAATLRGEAAGNFTNTSTPGRLVAATTPTSATSPTDRVAVESDGRLAVLTAPVELTEITAPAAPAANKAFLYVDDNGSGKTRLMVRFPTGAAIQLAIEP